MSLAFTQLVPLGFLTGLSLIVAIGAQNAYLLRLGVEARGRVILAAVSICALSDAVLILAGVLGIGAIIEAAPTAIDVVRFLGAAFLIGYGVMAARRALHPHGMSYGKDPEGASLRAVVLTTLALTWLNPHVYLDTVILLGSIANQHGGVDRWWWALGAVLASFAWFFSLGYGARLLKPLFARPAAWRFLDALIALIMIGLGVSLLLGG